MKKLNVLDWISVVLVIIGGLNWGLVGFFDFNLVGTLFGHATVITRIIYAVVGVAALYLIFGMGKCCKGCKKVEGPSVGGGRGGGTQ